MARYYFKRESQRLMVGHGEVICDWVWAIHDRDTNLRVGTLHDHLLAERVVDLLNQYEEKFDGR